MSSDLCIIIVLLIVLLIIFNRNIIEERFSDAVLRDLELSCSSVKVYPDRMVSQQYMYPEFTKGLDYIKNIGGGIGRDASGIGASLANSAADSMKMINIPNQEERDNYIKYGRELAGSISKKASGAASSIASKVPGAASSIASKVPGAASNITGKAAGAATKISNKVGGV